MPLEIPLAEVLADDPLELPLPNFLPDGALELVEAGPAGVEDVLDDPEVEVEGVEDALVDPEVDELGKERVGVVIGDVGAV